MEKQVYHSRITGCDYTTAKERFEYEEKFLQRIIKALTSSFDEARQAIRQLDNEIEEKINCGKVVPIWKILPRLKTILSN